MMQTPGLMAGFTPVVSFGSEDLYINSAGDNQIYQYSVLF